MNRTIFQIADSMMNLVENGYDDTTGEIATTQEEFNLMYDSIELELSTKIDNTNGLVKSIKSESEMIDNEIKRLQELKKRREQTIKWLTDRVDYVLKFQFTNEDGVLDVDGLKEAVKNLNKQLLHSQLSYRKSESIEIVDANKVPTDMKTVKVEESPSKTKIKEYFTENELTECEYARIKTNYGLSIK